MGQLPVVKVRAPFVEKSRAVDRRARTNREAFLDSFFLGLVSAVLHSPSLGSRLCSDQQLETADRAAGITPDL